MQKLRAIGVFCFPAASAIMKAIMLDGLLAATSQLHRPVFDDKYTADQAIIKATLLEHSESTQLTVVFLPWHVPNWYAAQLQVKLSLPGTSVLTYHFNPSILDTDIIRTKSSFEYIALAVAADVDTLQQENQYKSIKLLGISLGNVALCMVAEKLRHFDEVVMVVPGDDLADSLWVGWRTRRLRHRLTAEGINLQNLEKQWDILAPRAHVSAFQGHHVHIILAQRDRFIPNQYGKRLVRELKAVNPHVVFTEKPFGHLATIFSYASKR